MNFWNEQRIKEALPDARTYNFPPDWSSPGLIIWHENFIKNATVLIRRQGEARGLLPESIPKLINDISALMCTDSKEYFKYNKPVIEIRGNSGYALISMARYIRKKFKGKTIAVTGSSGKSTTTKIIFDILSKNFPVSSNQNKANTTWGISWNMTCFDINSAYWVIETSLGGGMSKNTAIVKPDYAIITNIAPVHLTNTMKLKDIAEEKSRIFNSMKVGASTILWKETEYFDLLKEAAEYKGLKVITYGESDDADIKVVCGNEYSFTIDGKTYYLGEEPVAKHIMFDMAAALAIVKEENLDINEALNYLKNFKTLAGRGEVCELEIDYNKKIKLIDESYNANPLSMKFAILGFKTLFPDENKVLILGDMAELGQDTEKYHIELADTIYKIRPKNVLLCGHNMKNLYETIKGKCICKYFDTVEELNMNIINELDDKDCVMIKSSHSSKLYTTVKELKKAGV